MAQDYWIDHDDPPFPAIRHRSHPKFDHRFSDLMTLTQAKKQVKEHCRNERQHWLAVMNAQLDKTPKALVEEAELTRMDPFA